MMVMEEGTHKQMLTFYRSFSYFSLLEIFGCSPLLVIRSLLRFLEVVFLLDSRALSLLEPRSAQIFSD